MKPRNIGQLDASFFHQNNCVYYLFGAKTFVQENFVHDKCLRNLHIFTYKILARESPL